MLHEIEELIDERSVKYGAPEDNLAQIGALWGIYLGIEPLSVRNVALMMILVKISRDCRTELDDNIRDILGYGVIAHRCSVEEEEE